MATRTLTIVLLAIAVVAAVGSVLASPWMLGVIGSGSRTDWQQFSFVGQTYGAASAILAVLALGGVAVSLTLQAREAKATREQALRGLHADLLKMAMDDPVYRVCWGPFFASQDQTAARQHMYTNMIISHWQLTFEVGTAGERHIREVAAVFFAGEIGRRFWRDGRDLRLKAEQGRRARRFHRILDEEYRRAVVRGASEPAPAAIAEAPPRRARRPSAPVVGLAAGLGGILVGWG